MDFLHNFIAILIVWASHIEGFTFSAVLKFVYICTLWLNQILCIVPISIWVSHPDIILSPERNLLLRVVFLRLIRILP